MRNRWPKNVKNRPIFLSVAVGEFYRLVGIRLKRFSINETTNMSFKVWVGWKGVLSGPLLLLKWVEGASSKRVSTRGLGNDSVNGQEVCLHSGITGAFLATRTHL